MNKWGEIIIGAILLVSGIIIGYFTLGKGFWDFGLAAWELLKGGIIWIIISLGILLIILGISDLKN